MSTNIKCETVEILLNKKNLCTYQSSEKEDEKKNLKEDEKFFGCVIYSLEII